MPRPFLIQLVSIFLFNILFCSTLFGQAASTTKINPVKTDSTKIDSVKKDSIKKTGRAKNVFLEIGGPGLFSANYDTRFSQTSNGFGARLGIGYLGLHSNNNITFPAQINYLIGKKNRFLELGIGETFIYYRQSDPVFLLPFLV